MTSGDRPAPPPRALGLSSTAVFAVSILIQFLGFIPSYFFSHGVGGGTSGAGRALIGTFQLFLLLASSINMIADLRIGSAYTFFVARGEPARSSTATYFLLRMSMVAAGGVFIWVLGPALGYTPAQYLGLFALWMTLPVLWTVSTVYSQLHIAQGDSVRGQLPLLIESIVRTSALTVVAVTISTYPAPNLIPEVTYAYLLGAGVAALLSIPAVARSFTRFERPVAKRLFTFAWPLMGSLLLLYVASTLIQFIVVANYPLNIYNVFLAANGYRILALAIPAAVAVPLFPHLSGLHQQRDYELVRVRTWAALRYTAMVVVPVVMGLAVYRTNILNIMNGAPYASQGATALALLALSALPAALSQIIGTALNSIGQQRLELYLTALQVGVLVLGALLFMRPIALFHFAGLDASGLAVLLSSIAALGLNTYFMGRLLAVRIQVRPILTLLGSAAAAFVAVSQFNDLLPVNRYYQLAAGVLLGFVVYFVVLALLGELSKADVRLLVASIGVPAALGELLARACWRAESWPVNPRSAAEGAGLRPIDDRAYGFTPPLAPPPPEESSSGRSRKSPPPR